MASSRTSRSLKSGVDLSERKLLGPYGMNVFEAVKATTPDGGVKVGIKPSVATRADGGVKVGVKRGDKPVGVKIGLKVGVKPLG